jgi:hypothetical protein
MEFIRVFVRALRLGRSERRLQFLFLAAAVGVKLNHEILSKSRRKNFTPPLRMVYFVTVWCGSMQDEFMTKLLKSGG